MTIAIDFVGTNIGSGTKTYNINFCNELESFELEEDIIIYISKDYFNQIKFQQNKNLNFICKNVFVKIKNKENKYFKKIKKEVLELHIAHNEGNYF